MTFLAAATLCRRCEIIGAFDRICTLCGGDNIVRIKDVLVAAFLVPVALGCATSEPPPDTPRAMEPPPKPAPPAEDLEAVKPAAPAAKKDEPARTSPRRADPTVLRGGGFWGIYWNDSLDVVRRKLPGATCDPPTCRGLVTMEGVPVKVSIDLSSVPGVVGFDLHFPPEARRYVLKALRDTYGSGHWTIDNVDVWHLPLGTVTLYAARATVRPGEAK